jgi:DNA-binding beta-propeller fold protein YncE
VLGRHHRPQGVAFDGTNIWVTNSSTGAMSKINAAGANAGTFTVGSNPTGVAFDGANIWVANSGSGTVSKLRVG